ncbi:MAG: hypothetical protein AAGB01_03760 [Cyanobacteria bacterium P01_F01_bin.42]
MALLTLNLVQGSVSFEFSENAANQLKGEIKVLMQTFKVAAVASQGRPAARPNLEYQFTGKAFIECFCNPNIWPSPFSAKVLLTIRDEHIRLTTEAELPQLIEDLNLYLEQF